MMTQTPTPRVGSKATGPRHRGVAYDTGTNFATGQGELSRTVWSTARMQGEMSMISEQLNCNSVNVYGSDLDRLADTAVAAVARGLHVWLVPRLVDETQQEIVEHLAEAARLAETLRRDGADIGLTAGAVHTIFTPGLIPGGQYHERMANVYGEANHRLLSPTATVDLAAAATELNTFLVRASAVARDIFHGDISYSAAPFEDVDWRLFDAVGLMWHYLPSYRTRPEHLADLRRYHQWRKPVLIAEFGTATYREAERKAFFFWDIVDRGGAEPTIVDGYHRDEDAQAAYHLAMFDLFDQAGVDGVAVSEFIHPTHPHSTDPRRDLDMASMAIVKTIRDDFADPASPYRCEPKASFHAIAAHYAGAGPDGRRRAVDLVGSPVADQATDS